LAPALECGSEIKWSLFAQKIRAAVLPPFDAPILWMLSRAAPGIASWNFLLDRLAGGLIGPTNIDPKAAEFKRFFEGD